MAKLVRDRIPEIIEQGGAKPIIRRLTGDDLINALDNKLTEEHEEYAESRSIEELADIAEVVFALARARGSSDEEFISTVEKKRAERGGFEEGIFWEGNEP